ncbi:MAG: GntR family transcriptional regulator [Gammaproteobacteria bacterium]|nr:GntR family transcriptional regulator [Gammaproteobacteria bacterium]
MEFRQAHAIYLQIADYLCEQILRKIFLAGAKIPSIRDLAIMVEVNPNTVVRTYNYLEEQGIIYKERGLGYFVAQDGHAKASALKKELFLREHLPEVFKNLTLLSMKFSDLQDFYKEYRDGLVLEESYEKK